MLSSELIVNEMILFMFQSHSTFLFFWYIWTSNVKNSFRFIFFCIWNFFSRFLSSWNLSTQWTCKKKHQELLKSFRSFENCLTLSQKWVCIVRVEWTAKGFLIKVTKARQSTYVHHIALRKTVSNYTRNLSFCVKTSLYHRFPSATSAWERLIKLIYWECIIITKNSYMRTKRHES